MNGFGIFQLNRMVWANLFKNNIVYRLLSEPAYLLSALLFEYSLRCVCVMRQMLISRSKSASTLPPFCRWIYGSMLYSDVKWFLGKFIDCRIFSLSFVDITHFFITHYTIPNKVHSYELSILWTLSTSTHSLSENGMRMVPSTIVFALQTLQKSTGYPVSHRWSAAPIRFLHFHWI